jgi:branched-chain amino acid aminotransferase
MSLVWINGRLVDKAEARISPFDHGFLYGDGVWEALRVFGGRLFRPDDHLARFYAAASGPIGIGIPLSPAELRSAIDATLQANNRSNGYIRVIVTSGPGTIGPDPRKLDPQVIIIAEEYFPFPLELYRHGLHTWVAPFPVNVLNPGSWGRTLGRPDIALNKRFVLKMGCLEAILTDTAGGVLGGTEGDLFLVREGQLFPVPPSSSVPSAVVLEIARAVLPVGFEAPVRVEQLHSSDEVFLAGTSCGIIGIVRIDGKEIGSGMEGPVTRSIREAYDRLTRGVSTELGGAP